MVIDDTNYRAGNKAMASILLLYYHLINEDGFTNDQTVYIDHQDFDGFSFIDTKIIEKNMSFDLDENLINEGAVIYLLCELNDMIADYDKDFLHQSYTEKIIKALATRKLSYVPEVGKLIVKLSQGMDELVYKDYAEALNEIYEKYVLFKFKSFVS
jgi:hypothetical protein